ncbi:hypothetical protein M0R04_12420 [Candidatus Dojkabacteria bacterium]|jgi:hypothetical protein|nr:hypothetical protein [Candidatus Dojkabacteria bacterium]
MKSDKPVLENNKVFGKRMFVFPMSYADANRDGKKGMMISIGAINTFVPCEEPVDLTYDIWMLLKNIGRIGRIVVVQPEDNGK